MSLLGGFDYVAEFSNTAVLNLIKANMKVDGVNINPDFELLYSINNGNAHLIVKDLQLDINDDDSLTLIFFFADTSFVMTPPINLVICPLDGNFSFKAPLSLSSGETQDLSLDLGSAQVIVNFSAQSNQIIIDKLAANADLFKDHVAKELTKIVRKMQKVAFPLSYNVVPHKQGSLSPLQLESLEVHCIGNQDRNLQALCFFGNIFLNNKYDYRKKTTTALVRGPWTVPDNVCISISSHVFHVFLFCPSVWESFGGIMKCTKCGYWYEPSKGYQVWNCSNCGFSYIPDPGDPAIGLPPDPIFEDLGANWTCPVCGAKKDTFLFIKPDTPFDKVWPSWKCPGRYVGDICGASKDKFKKVEINTCGPEYSIERGGVKITSLADRFSDGFVNMDGSFEKSGTCYKAYGTFHSEITFDAIGKDIKPIVKLADPYVHVDIPLYCEILFPIFGGIAFPLIMGAVEDAANKVAREMANSGTEDFLKKSMKSINVGEISDATFNQVDITSEGLTMNGIALVNMPDHNFTYAGLKGSVTTASQTILNSGIWHTRLICEKEDDDFPWTEYAQQQIGIYTIESKLVPTPLKVEFSLSGGDPETSVGLTGEAGTAAIPNVRTKYVAPFPKGSEVVQTVNITYEISENVLKLSNVPSEGTYSVYLCAKMMDCRGVPLAYWDSSTVQIDFQGNFVEIGNNYKERWQHCMAELENWGKSMADKYAPLKEVARWIEVDFPAPEDLNEVIRELFVLGTPLAEEILVQTKLAHGESFYRAIFARSAKESGAKASKAIKLQSTITKFKAKIAELTKQLDEIGNDFESQVGKG